MTSSPLVSDVCGDAICVAYENYHGQRLYVFRDYIQLDDPHYAERNQYYPVGSPQLADVQAQAKARLDEYAEKAKQADLD